jgi:hypothetical protein
MMKKIVSISISLSVVCALIIFSFLVGEYLNTKINSHFNVGTKSTQKDIVDKDAIYAENYSSCIHFDTCIKCQKNSLKR